MNDSAMRRMRLVIDTNQARSIPATLCLCPPNGVVASGLTVPPYILGEVLLRGHVPRNDTLARLRWHSIRIGFEPAVLVEHLASKSPSEIAAFEPFPRPSDSQDALYRSLLHEDGPALSSDAAEWARQVKDARLALSVRFKSQSAAARSDTRLGKIRKLNTFSEALRAENGLKSFVVSLLSSGGKRKMQVADNDELYQAVMSNVFLRHFFHAWLFYTISLTRLWANPKLNRDAVQNRDDMADLLIALYVGGDDVIVSEDRLVRDAFAMIDPSIKVIAASDL